jgi:hypothetical protein
MTVSAALLRRVLRHPEGLLCALALDPATLSRNRNFALYATQPLRRVHGRARALRSLARAASMPSVDRTVEVERSGDSVVLVLRSASLAFTRRAMLDPLELSLLKVLVSRAPRQTVSSLEAAAHDLQTVTEALARVRLRNPLTVAEGEV